MWAPYEPGRQEEHWNVTQERERAIGGEERTERKKGREGDTTHAQTNLLL